MKSSRSPTRRRSAPSVVAASHGQRMADDTDRDDPPPPYVMRQTRLRGALEDAHGIIAHQQPTEVPRPQRAGDARQLEQLLERMAGGSTASYLSTPSIRADQEDHARAAVATQVAALERQCSELHACADGLDSIQQAMRSELEVSSSSSDPLKLVDKSGASTWYVLSKVVGKGTFGRVQLARHRVSNARVAIKSYFRDKGALVCSPPPQSSSSSARRAPAKPAGESDALEWKRVRQEVKLMASLRPHAGLIGFIEAFESPTQLQVVMEFASGGSLCELLKKQPHQRLPESKARRLFVDLCGAVDALHRQNVIHRDLKLENVLLDEQLHPRIIDFGFSQREFPTARSELAASSRTLPTARAVKNFCGTPSYMAPEVVSCKSYDGKLVDVWSLGIILYLLLCGKFPFQATNLHQLYQTIRSAPIAFPSHVSKDAQHLVQSILVVDPLKRATIAAIQDHTWMKQIGELTNQVGETALARERVFDPFIAWEHGVSTVCHALARLYKLDADSLLRTVHGASRSNSSSVVALVRLTMLTAEQQFYVTLQATTTTPSPTSKHQNASAAVVELSKAAAPSVKPPPSPRLQAASDGRTHKQQLEQLIGLVKKSLG